MTIGFIATIRRKPPESDRIQARQPCFWHLQDGLIFGSTIGFERHPQGQNRRYPVAPENRGVAGSNPALAILFSLEIATFLTRSIVSDRL
jgi:hypothetical protein